jgi:hypothetical protein
VFILDKFHAAALKQSPKKISPNCNFNKIKISVYKKGNNLLFGLSGQQLKAFIFIIPILISENVDYRLFYKIAFAKNPVF